MLKSESIKAISKYLNMGSDIKIYSMIEFKLFDEVEEFLRECVVSYVAISAKEINKVLNTAVIDSLTNHTIR
ncbi:MAG: hypothetical protein GX660_11535 [Clostridiaceae bacterium]|nr:hypothetical protein [Clostridiaceae bacterium]